MTTVRQPSPPVAAHAGVGARRILAEILALMRALAAGTAWLVLRTGGAAGADQAFAQRARRAGGAVEMFLPWSAFEHHAGGAAHASERGRVRARGAPSPRLAASDTGRLGAVRATLTRCWAPASTSRRAS
jgi:hypothetical protein